MYVYIVCTCEKENCAMCAHCVCVCVCVYLYVFMLAIWHHFLSQFLPLGVRSASYRSAISFKWTLSSLSLEGNLIPLFLHLSFPEICTSHESEERVRIIPRENRPSAIYTSRARCSRSKEHPIESDILAVSRIDSAKENVSRIPVTMRRGKDFPYRTITQFSRRLLTI